LGVTSPVEATGTGTRYDIGGGNNYGTDLADLPWGSLQPGDAVNVYHRATPYREKPLITEAGTALNPIIINGVTDEFGNRPIIDGENAVALMPNERTYFDGDHVGDNAFEQGVVVFHRKSTATGGVYGSTADHIKFQNFHVRNADDGMQYTVNGVTHTYLDYARAIWLYANEYITIEGCIIENGQEGLFAGAPGEKPCKTVTVRGNRFINNGFEAGFLAHQLYMLCYCEPDEYNVIEGNYFDSIQTPICAQAKVRSAGTVIRYNTFKAGGRIIDLVEAQDTLVDFMYLNYTPQQIVDKYRTSYIYGNVIVNDDSLGDNGLADWIIHSGWDTLEYNTAGLGGAIGEPTGRGIGGGKTYVFNNTIYRDSTYNNIPTRAWRGGLFDVDGFAASQEESTIVAANNVIQLSGGTLAAQMRFTGRLDWESTNLVFLEDITLLAESDEYANTFNSGDDPAVLINANDTRITTNPLLTDPSNVNFLLRDYTLNTGSPAIGAATALPAELSAFPVQFNAVDVSTGVMSPRATTANLGAIE
jgi:hypothetical protein